MNSADTYVSPQPEFFETATDSVAFQVHGDPAPQGSKQGFSRIGSTRVQMVESSRKVKPWRVAVVAAAVDAMNGREPLAGPVSVSVTFRLLKPRTVKRDIPFVRPDLDKLCRSTLDALTTSQVVANDAQVCDLTVSKRYGTPGADIIVTVIEATA